MEAIERRLLVQLGKHFGGGLVKYPG